jgi:hypothetical protein
MRQPIYEDYLPANPVKQKPAPVTPTIDSEAPLSQEAFDALIKEGDAAAAAGDVALAEGNALAIAAGNEPIILKPSSPISGKEISGETRDAFDVAKAILKSWNLEELADTFTRLMSTGITADAAMVKIKYDKSIDPVTGKAWNDSYNTRFKGNELRVAKGMNAYDEGTYLDVENSYNNTLRQYGLSNLINPDAKITRAKYAEYMGNGIAPTEFAERIQTVADRVINMDPAIKEQFQAYYPSLSNTDIISYFLDPKETLPVLKNKVTAAEIGAVAGAAKYGIDEARAMDLAKFGVSRAQALAGYQDIAEVTPTAGKLSSIYNEEDIKYGQTEAENDFLKQDAQAKIKRNRLASKERAMFAGQSGVNADTFGRSNNF